MARKKILVVDDEININELITINLEKNGFKVISCLTGEEAMRIAKSELPAIIILDLMLPGIDGFQVCKEIRKESKTAKIPIIMLTAKVGERDKIIGLELGADDYITKPFSVMELIARVKAVLRRIDDKEEKVNTHQLYIRDIEMDLEKYTVKKNEEKIDLTLKEFNLLRALAENREKVLTREFLLKEISNDDSTAELRSIDVHVTNLRKKLGTPDSDHEYIETIRGIGYKMN